MFRNCLIAMRPKSALVDLPTMHQVVTHLHNEFIKWLAELKEDIEVHEHYTKKKIKTYQLFRQHPVESPQQQICGLLMPLYYHKISLSWHHSALDQSRAHHELTCRSIQIRPTGILISKILIRNHMDKFPWVTCLNRSGTCRTTDHPWITGTCRYPQVFAGTYYNYYIKCIPVSKIL